MGHVTNDMWHVMSYHMSCQQQQQQNASVNRLPFWGWLAWDGAAGTRLWLQRAHILSPRKQILLNICLLPVDWSSAPRTWVQYCRLTIFWNKIIKRTKKVHLRTCSISDFQSKNSNQKWKYTEEQKSWILAILRDNSSVPWVRQCHHHSFWSSWVVGIIKALNVSKYVEAISHPRLGSSKGYYSLIIISWEI